MSRLNTFVPPRPNTAVMAFMTQINRWFIVGGLPWLKYLRPRPLTRITDVYFPEADQAKLRSLVERKRTAVFITPNHPEFFTDWMLDKHVLSLVAPRAASWATHVIVNGMGAVAQRFWLANNLIAQIPRLGNTAKLHSIKVAARGDGVLLHPEGTVGWHGNYIAPLFPGAVDMALETLALNPEVTSSYIVPVVWKITFTADVTEGLHAEYRYICRQLKIVPMRDLTPAEAVYHLFEELLTRDEVVVDIHANRDHNVWERLPAYLNKAQAVLSGIVGSDAKGTELLRAARKWQHSQANSGHDVALSKKVAMLLASIERWNKFCSFARSWNMVTQEELAEHQKRIRSEYCVGGLRNTVNKFVPIAVGPRHASIRVLEPFQIERPDRELTRAERSAFVDDLTLSLRTRLQMGVTDLKVEEGRTAISYPNPFL